MSGAEWAALDVDIDDLVSYMLKLNKFPAGQEELKSGADGLKAISFAKKSR